MSSHSFNFYGGDILSKIGASWFVSYAYHIYIDSNSRNFNKVKTYTSRIVRFNNSKQYHIFWLKQILNMDDHRLDTNKIYLNAKQIKEMSSVLLHKLENNPLEKSDMN